MKYFLISVVFAFAALMVYAQTNIPKLYMYRQKPLNNKREMLFPDLQNNKIVPAQNNAPVLQLKNEGVKVGSNNLGDVYSMSTDNMPCLKPFETKDQIPNALQPTPALPAIPKKKK